MKSFYLHFYLLPTRLFIFRKNSHLHVYLVYMFIQYQGVCIQIVVINQDYQKFFKMIKFTKITQKALSLKNLPRIQY